jgi:putative tryptophan/tyrosine transport system substrate-binding protein
MSGNPKSAIQNPRSEGCAECAGKSGQGDSMKTGLRHEARGNSRRSAVWGVTLCAALFALCSPVGAQQPHKIPRIGFLVAPSESFFSARLEGFRLGLRNLGYIEGKNIVIEYRYAEGNLRRLPELAAELVHLNVDVIVASGPSSLAAKNATNVIPIVFAAVQDPVASGLVSNLATPGGNVTGLSTLAPELGGKRLELLKEVVPKITRAAFLWGAGVPTATKEIRSAAQGLGLQLHSLEVRNAKDLDVAFEAAMKERVQGLLTSPGAFINTYQTRIVEFTAKNRLPAIYTTAETVEAGGLMSYAPNQIDQFRRAAIYVDKILKGAKPADLPIEQPTKFELIINLKAAKQIGLTIPPNVLARADKVIR